MFKTKTHQRFSISPSDAGEYYVVALTPLGRAVASLDRPFSILKRGSASFSKALPTAMYLTGYVKAGAQLIMSYDIDRAQNAILKTITYIGRISIIFKSYKMYVIILIILSTKVGYVWYSVYIPSGD